jgi:hypothetical protein
LNSVAGAGNRTVTGVVNGALVAGSFVRVAVAVLGISSGGVAMIDFVDVVGSVVKDGSRPKSGSDAVDVVNLAKVVELMVAGGIRVGSVSSTLDGCISGVVVFGFFGGLVVRVVG